MPGHTTTRRRRAKPRPHLAYMELLPVFEAEMIDPSGELIRPGQPSGLAVLNLRVEGPEADVRALMMVLARLAGFEL